MYLSAFYRLPNFRIENCRTYCTELQNQMEIIPKLNRCLYQKQIKHYTTTAVEQVELESVLEDLNNITDDMNVHLSITFPSKYVTIFEEILIFDEISLIGSLGGSLGLFVGFSFFGYITTFLDVILDKIFEWIG